MGTAKLQNIGPRISLNPGILLRSMAELSRNEIIGQKLTGNAKIQKMSEIWICQDLGGSCELKNLDFWMTLHLQEPFLERPDNLTQFKIMI